MKHEEKGSLEVKTDGAHDVLVRRQALVDDIGVVDNVTAEDEATTNSEDEVHGTAEGDEDANEAGHACLKRLAWVPRGQGGGNKTDRGR